MYENQTLLSLDFIHFAQKELKQNNLVFPDREDSELYSSSKIYIIVKLLFDMGSQLLDGIMNRLQLVMIKPISDLYRDAMVIKKKLE